MSKLFCQYSLCVCVSCTTVKVIFEFYFHPSRVVRDIAQRLYRTKISIYIFTMPNKNIAIHTNDILCMYSIIIIYKVRHNVTRSAIFPRGGGGMRHRQAVAIRLSHDRRRSGYAISVHARAAESDVPRGDPAHPDAAW